MPRRGRSSPKRESQGKRATKQRPLSESFSDWLSVDSSPGSSADEQALPEASELSNQPANSPVIRRAYLGHKVLTDIMTIPDALRDMGVETEVNLPFGIVVLSRASLRRMQEGRYSGRMGKGFSPSFENILQFAKYIDPRYKDFADIGKTTHNVKALRVLRAGKGHDQREGLKPVSVDLLLDVDPNDENSDSNRILDERTYFRQLAGRKRPTDLQGRELTVPVATIWLPESQRRDELAETLAPLRPAVITCGALAVQNA